MRIDQQPAFLLHTRSYRETSLLLDAFTREHGRVGLIARGVRSARNRGQRALLQPGQPLLLSWRAGFDLPLLLGVDAGNRLPRMDGDAVLAMFYVNELLLRLLPQADPVPDLFDVYTRLLPMLSQPERRSWSLRCFEFDVLSTMGYGLIVDVDSEERVIDRDACYRHIGDCGPRRLPPGATIQPEDVRGAALLALQGSAEVEPVDLPSLRRYLRARIAEQLGGRQLNAWRLAPLMSGSRRRESGSGKSAAASEYD